MPHVFILESDPSRISAMREELAEHLPGVESTFFDNAPEAIAFLDAQIERLSLISLDHDLGTESVRNGRLFDPGSGRDVAHYLCGFAPSCPVILHTDNFFVRPTMQAILDEGGWEHSFVAPGNGTRWVADAWISRVSDLLARRRVADPALSEVVETWPMLSANVKTGILEAVRRSRRFARHRALGAKPRLPVMERC